MDNVYEVFNNFLTTYDLYPRDVPGHPGYTATQLGVVHKPDGTEAKQFNSSGYKQVRMINADGKRSIKGVHQVVAMTFDKNYYDGCVVHHKDGNKHNNCLENLESTNNSDHARHHADPSALIAYNRIHGPANKGKKMSKEFCEKCRQSALNRNNNRNNECKFGGNQYVNADGSKKEVSEEFKLKFSEACRRGALNRRKT